MPHLKFRGVEEKILMNTSKKIIDAVSNISKCNREHVTVELEHTTFYYDGVKVEGDLIIEIHWFKRDQSIKDQLAKEMTHIMNSVGYKDVAIIYHNLTKNSYYDNGVSYA